MKRRLRGQSLVEYAVCTAAVALALCAPLGGEPPPAVRLAVALVRRFEAFAFLIGLS